MSLFSMCMMDNGYPGFKIVVVRLLNLGKITFCYYYCLEYKWNSYSRKNSHCAFILLTFCLLRSLAAVSNSFYLSFFSILPFFLGHFYCNNIRNFDLPHLHFTSNFWAVCQISHSHFIHIILSAFLTHTTILTTILTRLFICLLFLC